jgi:Putative F0F1-ATPase subunit Ca2+/Mg2+ transporter
MILMDLRPRPGAGSACLACPNGPCYPSAPLSFNAGSEPPREPPPRGGRGADWTEALREAAPYLGIGTGAAVTVLAGLGAGYVLDGKLGTRPLLFLLGGAFGILAALWQVYTLVMGRRS